ncbi:hypothetical protein D5S17_26220 [Pseudonocardiaceae bacterium YIM PH 21723]|nr:hypothetical protein D5S17_26220 [Pseudonocardiaceae bacterium YIM PH 21723]
MKSSGVVMIIVGLVLAGYLGVRGWESFPGKGEPFPAGAPITVTLTDPGLVIFGASYNAQDLSAGKTQCTATDGAGQQIALVRDPRQQQISSDDVTWDSLWRSSAPQPAGAFTVTCTAARPETRFAVGPHVSIGPTIGYFGGALLAAFIGLFAGIFLIVRGDRRTT